jgi:3D (Asp-Asp-Asp) domain-containing protein
MMFAVPAFAQANSNNNKNVKKESYVIKTVSVEAVGYKSFVATAYTLRGKMANGQNVHVGAIAADPKVLPLGTIVYIEGMGQFTVKDTGSAIKGNRVDIWMPKGAIQFGKRVVKLRVISKPQRKIKT